MNYSIFLLKWSALIAVTLSLLIGCASNNGFTNSVSVSRRNASSQVSSNIPVPLNQFPLPNVEAYAHHPIPAYVNFYTIRVRYPDYLRVEYGVDKKNYIPSDESKWFKASLKQIRRYGPTKFPPIKWIAVIICNQAEWNGNVADLEQSYKAGVIFKASEVFDASFDLSKLVTHAEIDRHPFHFDQSLPTPGEQQRWLIVERHAATNFPSMKREIIIPPRRD